MTRTPDEHFDEADWLDYVQEVAKPDVRERLEQHLGGCSACRTRVEEFRDLLDALPGLPELLADDLFLREAEGPRESSAPDSTLELLVERATRDADLIVKEEERCRAEVAAQLAAGQLLRNLAEIRTGHLVAASALIRDLFRTDLKRVEALLKDAFAALGLIEDREDAAVVGAEGILCTLRAHLTHMNGDSAAALEELAVARPMLDRLRFGDLEIAYWSYSRATALHMLTRHDDAIEEIGEAIRAYADFEDWGRLGSTLCYTFASRLWIARMRLASFGRRPLSISDLTLLTRAGLTPNARPISAPGLPVRLLAR